MMDSGKDEGVRYRAANGDDASRIAALHAENWRRSYRGNFRDAYLDGDVDSDRRRVWTARLGQPSAHQFVCLAVEPDRQGAERVLGFVCAYGAHDRAWGSFIDNLHVEPGLQGRGIGTELLRQAGDWLSQHFAEQRVYLFVWESNPARSLYQRLGGRHAETLEIENPGGGRGREHRDVLVRPARQNGPPR
jgi:ribosomal protein S18 acetylase RimI-like enzyme